MRLIDADALKKALGEQIPNINNVYDFATIVKLIEHAPTVEPEKAKESELIKAYTKGFDTGVETVKLEGEWIDINKQGKTGDGRTFTFPITICSVCKKSTGELYNFCPNCGAKMKGGSNG